MVPDTITPVLASPVHYAGESGGGTRFVNLPAQYHSVQFLFAPECATHALHFAAPIDGVPCRD